MEGKRKKHRWPIALGVVVVVLAGMGGGFWVWHEQPSFCNAICHEPMDNYVDGYYHDTSLLANAHEREEVSCLKCHETNVDQQVAEGISWIRGDYAVDTAGNIEAKRVTADTNMCAQSACHNFDKVIAATENWGGQIGVNPHSSHQGIAIDCSNCHGVHGESYLFCNTCHDYALPANWQNPR